MSSDSDEVELLYEVEEVMGMKAEKGKIYYKIRWKGYDETTWEPIQHLRTVKQMVHEFERKRRDTPTQNKSVDQKPAYPKPSKRRMRKTAMKRDYETPVTRQNRMKNKNNTQDIEGSQDEVTNQKEKKGLSRRIEEDSESEEYQDKGGPRFKVTKWFPEEIEERNQVKHRVSVCTHQISRILNVQKQEGTWMAQVEFQASPDRSVWVNRDILRLLHPLTLLEFYEEQYYRTTTHHFF